jgi:hypothetical protein
VIVTKESAARSQLETAIRLWFNDGDPVSIHTLAAAANELLNRVGSKFGKQSPVQKYIEARPEVVGKRLRKAQNFFKHAYTDLNERLDYDPAHGDLLILDSILLYHALFGSMTRLMAAFTYRLSLTEPALASLGFPAEMQKESSTEFCDLSVISRSEFLEKFLRIGTQSP